jgi:PAS domain S-box-containing protein
VLLAAALEQAPTAVLLLSGTGVIEFANPAFERVSGLTRAEVSGRRATFLRDAQNRDVFRKIAARVADGLPWTGVLSVRVAPRDRAHFDVMVTPTRAPTGEIHLFCVARDVTRESHLQRAQRLEAVGRLAGGLAHDFNNILGVIESSASHAQRHVEPGSPAAVELAEIREAVKSASSLSRQLLTFGSDRAAAGAESESLPDVVIQRVQKMFGRLVGETVALQVDVEADLPHIAIDGSKLEQVMANLVVNARDAMPSGGCMNIGARLVTVDRHAIPPGFDALGGEYVRLTVEDDGCGMDEGTQSRIFEPFFTTKGPEEGTGLGLATVYGLVCQAGGFLEVRSSLGQGTEFRIHLPVVRTPRARLNAIAARAGATPPACEGRVLVVSDKAAVRATLARRLGNAGFQIVEARGVREALAGLDAADHDPDLVVIEAHVLDGCGEDVVRELRARRPGLPVVFLTGSADEGTMLSVRWSPNAEAVSQPFGEPGLAKRVRSLLDRAGSRRAAEAEGRGAG